MARGDQLGRQWKIIQILISAKKGRSVSDLADQLETNPRSVYRDLEALQIAGFPVYNEREGNKNLWLILNIAKKEIPIPFTITELMALYFGRDMLKVLKNTVFHDSLESVLQKIKVTMAPEIINYLERLEESLEVGPRPYKEYGHFKQIMEGVNQAIINKQFIQIIYYTISRKVETRRKVAPYKLWFFDETFYLIGFCEMRKTVRIFALDRIREFCVLDDFFKIPAGFDLDDFMKDSFGVFHGEPINVKIRFAPKIAEYIKEKVWHGTQEIIEQNDGSILFTAKVAGIQEIKFWVLRWGAAATVIEPALLRDEIHKEAAGMISGYEKGERKCS